MSADLLREAAALMRKRAEAAMPGPWEQTGVMGSEYNDVVDCPGAASIVADTDTSDENAEHIASWHPDVALAVADWLEATAREFDALGDPDLSRHPLDGRRTAAVAVARAYLGRDQ